jgi:hypothetical protein
MARARSPKIRMAKILGDRLVPIVAAEILESWAPQGKVLEDRDAFRAQACGWLRFYNKRLSLLFDM